MPEMRLKFMNDFLAEARLLQLHGRRVAKLFLQAAWLGDHHTTQHRLDVPEFTLECLIVDCRARACGPCGRGHLSLGGGRTIDHFLIKNLVEARQLLYVGALHFGHCLSGTKSNVPVPRLIRQHLG